MISHSIDNFISDRDIYFLIVINDATPEKLFRLELALNSAIARKSTQLS